MDAAGVVASSPSRAAPRRRPQRRPPATKVAAVAAALAAGIAATIGVLVARRSTTVASPRCNVSSATANRVYTLSAEQAQNAAIIAAAAYEKRLPDHAVTVALAVSLQESGLRNLPYGDRDSLGLFQQRPSQGWGTSAQLLDPVYAAAAFYGRLAQVPGWQAMAVTDAAQAVQHSAAPGAYAAWEGEARALAIALTGEVAAGMSCRFSQFAGAVPAPTALAQAMTAEMGADLVGVPVTAKTGWQAAAWVVAHAYKYHVHRVSFGGRTWQPSSPTWEADPNPGSTQTVTVQHT
jgi:hypothetical protein